MCNFLYDILRSGSAVLLYPTGAYSISFFDLQVCYFFFYCPFLFFPISPLFSSFIFMFLPVASLLSIKHLSLREPIVNARTHRWNTMLLILPTTLKYGRILLTVSCLAVSLMWTH